MHDLKKFGKKLFTMSVVSMTMAWSVGLSALVPAGAALAACPELSAGDLFKVKGNSAVYLLNANMERMYFPNADVYNTWYKDFSGITTIEPTCVDAYPSGGGVNFRPGSFLVKSSVSPSVFAVGPNNMKMKIADEATASALYGSNWGKLVRILPDVFDSNYKVGAELKTAVLHDGQLVKKSGETTVYYVWGGKLKKVDGSVPSQTAGDVRTVSATTFASVPMDTATVTGSTVTNDATQKGGSTTTPGTTPPPTPGAVGSLKVSLAGDTPSGTYAIKNAARVAFTKLVFENTGSTAVTVDSFQVVRGGAPAINADFGNINVVDQDGNLLNDSGKTLNSENMVTFTEDIVLNAGEKKYYTLVGDMASGLVSGDVPTLGVYSITTTATVSATLPLYGNPVTTNANVTLATATLTQGSAIGTVTKQVGATNVNLASLKVNGAGEDTQVSRIMLYNSGTAAQADLDKFVMKYNNTEIAKGVMKGKYLTFDLSACTTDCKLEKGNDKTYEVYGDIVGGSGRTIDLDVQKVVHVLVKDLKNGYYVTPAYGTTSAAAMSNNITVSQGKLDVSKVNDVATGNIPENAISALGSWNFKVTGESIDVRTIVFKLTTTGTVTSTDIDAITLYNKDGKALIGGVDGAIGNAGSNVGYATSTDTFTLPVGDNVLTVKAKITSSAAANDTVVVGIDMANSTNFDARGVNTGDTITLNTYATPQSVVSANTMTVKSSALTVTTMSTPPATTYAAGTNDVVLEKVLFDASESSEDIRVTQVKVNDTTNGTAKTINIQNVRIFVDKDGDSYNGTGTDTALTETVSGSDSTAGNDETLTFNLSGADQFVIKAGKKLVMTVKANIAGGAATGTHTTATNVANDVSATGVTTGSTVTESVDTSPSGQAITVGVAGGTAELTLDPSSVTAKQFAAGTKGVTLATLHFFATSSEDVEIDKLTLTQVVTNTASSSFKDYDMVYLVDESGTTVGSVAPTSTSPLIDLGDKLFVVKPSNTNGQNLYVKVDLSSIGSNQNVTVGGHQIGFKVNVAGQVAGKGALTGTGSVIYFGATSPTGNTHYMFKGTPTVQICSGTEDNASNCTKVGGTLGNGTNDLMRFRVTANTADVGLGKFTFDITTTTASITSVSLVDVTESNEVVLYNNTPSGGFSNSVAYVEATLNATNPDSTDGSIIERTVSKGTSRYFVLRGNATTVSSGASVSTRLGGDTAGPIGNSFNNYLMASTTPVDSNASNDDFIWSDRSANTHSTTTNDWTNGYLVSGLPSTSSTPSVVAK